MIKTANLRPDQMAFHSVMEVVEQYFYGLHHGDTDILREIFDPDVVIFTPGNKRTVEAWLSDVERRDVPAQVGLPYLFKIHSAEVVGDQAMVKVDCPLFDFLYVDFLGLLQESGQWRIVSKMYVDTSTNKGGVSCPI